MITYQESFFESYLQKIARIISHRYGVTVSIGGDRAYVNMKTLAIVLPSMGDLKFAADHFDGFLDHECAHVKFTDRTVFEKIEGNRVLHGLWNVCEDVWVERKMGSEYYGCHQNLQKLNEWASTLVQGGWGTLDAFGKLTHALDQCYRGVREKEFYKDDTDMGAIIMQLGEEINRGRTCLSSTEAFSIAQSVYDKIKDLSAEKETNKGMPKESDHGDDTSDSVATDSGTSSGSHEQDGQGEEGEDLSDRCQVPEKPGEGSGESESDSDTQFPKEGLSEEEQDRGEQDRGDQDRGEQQARSFMNSEESFDEPADIESLMNESMGDVAKDYNGGEPTKYVVFTSEFDYDTTYSATERAALSEKYKEIREEVSQYIGSLSNTLEMTLYAESACRWVGGARRGKKFDQRRLAYWSEGSDDDRVFRQLEEGVNHDTAVTLLWDCSGSMRSSSYKGSKAQLARIAAVAFHEALKRCRNISHEILGFNTNGNRNEELSDMIRKAERMGDDLHRYSRLGGLDARMVFVPFGSDDGRALVNINGAGENRDGECVLWAAQRLAHRPERRKILIVGSDGQPSGARYSRLEETYLRDVVQRVIGAGIEVFGLGIMDKSVKYYYPNYRVIHKASELPRAVMTLLTASLPAQNKGRTNERVAGI